MLTSARRGIIYPNTTRVDSADVPRDIAALVAALEVDVIYGQGTLAARPVSSAGTPGIQGRIYTATDQSPVQVYYDFGTGWAQIGALAAGSVGTTQIADLSVTTTKLVDLSVTAAKIAATTITAAKIVAGTITATQMAAALFPSQGAAGATEAFRALGTGAGQAMAGNITSLSLSGGFSAPGMAVAGSIAFQASVTPDTQVRFIINADGKHQWGPGGATAADTTLQRAGVATLSINGQLTAAPATSVTSFFSAPSAAQGNVIASQVSGEANARFYIGYNGIMNWGAGGASAVDTTLFRDAVNALGTNGPINSRAQVAGTSVFGAFATGDSVARLVLYNSGAIDFGPGGATAVDMRFYRVGAQNVRIQGLAGYGDMVSFAPTATDNDAAMGISWRKAGVEVPNSRVTVGAADSGGVGFRVLRVAN